MQSPSYSSSFEINYIILMLLNQYRREIHLHQCFWLRNTSLQLLQRRRGLRMLEDKWCLAEYWAPWQSPNHWETLISNILTTGLMETLFLQCLTSIKWNSTANTPSLWLPVMDFGINWHTKVRIDWYYIFRVFVIIISTG